MPHFIAGVRFFKDTQGLKDVPVFHGSTLRLVTDSLLSATLIAEVSVWTRSKQGNSLRSAAERKA